MKDVSLSINVSRMDCGFIRETIPHIVRSCNYPFTEILIVADVSEPTLFFNNRRKVFSARDLMEICDLLVKDIPHARVAPIDYTHEHVRSIMKRYFHRANIPIKDFRGALVYGFLYGIDEAHSDYIVHFDSDILIFNRTADLSWIDEGARILDEYDDIIVVTPLSGPPRRDGNIVQDAGVSWVHDPRKFIKLDNFTTRKFLIKKSKLQDHLLPISALHLSWARHVLSGITGRSSLLALEQLISAKLRQKRLYRAEISNGSAWTLHSPDHGKEFLHYLSEIISLVERGEFPLENAGKYDLDTDAFIRLCKKYHFGS